MSERRRYTYAESRMKPPFWIVMDRRRRMAEAWDENDAALLVAALNHFAARPADRPAPASVTE